MNKSDLIKRLQDIEWEDFEVKEASIELPKNIWETVSAFSNTAGGWIVLGVKQIGRHFEINGVTNPEKTEQNFTTVLRGEKFNVKLAVTAKKYSFDDKTVLLFYIPLSDKKPVYFNSPVNTFIRTASGDQRATKEEIDAMYRDQAFGTKTDKTIPGSDITWLDSKSVNEYRQYIKRNNSAHSYNKFSDADFLKKVRVIVNNKITYSGLLFLGKNDKIQNVITDFRIDYFEIPGTSYSNALTRYTFRLGEQENLWQYYFAIFNKLSQQIDLPFKLQADGTSTTSYPYLEALREALVNILQHTEYFSNMKPRIRCFNDRIEFYNPGGLPKPLEKIIQEDISLPRNGIIAKLFRVANLAENGGYGFDKMQKGWIIYNNTIPLYEYDIDSFKVVFNTVKQDNNILEPEIDRGQTITDLGTETGDRQEPVNLKLGTEPHWTGTKEPKTGDRATLDRDQTSPKLGTEPHWTGTKEPQNRDQSHIGQGPDKPKTETRATLDRDQSLKNIKIKDKQKTKKLTKAQMTVLEIIVKNNSISRKQIAELLEIKEGIVIKHIEALKKKKVIERVGADFGGYWKVLISITEL
ncbi:MAG: RNA-binding domain-containing protein [bacterium]